MASEEGTDGFEFADAGDGLAGGSRLEIVERQAEKMPEQPAPQLDIDAVGGVRQCIGAQILEHDIEEADDGKPDDEHDQRRIAAMRQHLVDDDLEEKRRDQCEELDEQRCDQHMSEGAAVAPDRRQEPAKTECCRISARSAEAPLNQDEPSAREPQQFGGIDIAAGKIDRIDEPKAPFAGFAAEDGEGTIREAGDCRHRHRSDTAGRRGNRPGFEADQACGSQEVVGTGGAGDGQLTGNCPGIRRQAVIAGDGGKRRQAAVRLPFSDAFCRYFAG